ncbi:MAG: hypothetical protein H6658_02485 [Ardenticatenaceae bacterium]|nr:hypothetical protein [Ardenticatenaceae bacterium]
MDGKENLRFRDLWLWVGIALFWMMLPFVLAWLMTPADKFFMGVLANHNDFSGYTTAMRQGAEGEWLLHFYFSPESWQPQFVLFFYILMGKVIRPFSDNYALWANVLRGLGLLGALWGIHFWLREALPGQRRQQLTAWLFTVFGGGLGWLLWPLTTPFNVPLRYFPDVAMPEWSTTLIAINPPHYIWGMALEALLFGSVLRMIRRENSWRWAGLTAVLALILGIVYVYHLAVTAAIIGLYLLLLAYQQKQIPWRHWWQGVMIVLPLLPLLFYYGYWVNRDEAWATYVAGELNHIPPPPVLGLLLGFGLLGILAVIGSRRWWQQKRDWLLPAWVMGNLLVMYLPIVQYSGRFTMGLIIPVATLAAYGLEESVLPYLQTTRFFTRLARYTPTPYDTTRRLALLFATPSTLLVILFLIKNTATQDDFPYYMPAHERTAMLWLAEQVDEQAIVLAYYPVGNYLPGLGNVRVFMGHFGFTINFPEKAEMVEQFWQSQTSRAWREAFIEEWQITHIYVGQYERQLMQSEVIPPGERVYDQDDIQIYEVMP